VGEISFQATIAEIGKQQFPSIAAFGSGYIELSYKAGIVFFLIS
jgi:hypothetical protein